MTREEIENIPETVDCLLDESVTEPTREKLKERLKEMGDLAIKTLEQTANTPHLTVDEYIRTRNKNND